MIRFLDLKDQILEGSCDFAFYDTVTDTICSFGEEQEQVFSSVGEFQYAYGKEQEGTTRPLSRFISLIPNDFFKVNEEAVKKSNRQIAEEIWSEIKNMAMDDDDNMSGEIELLLNKHFNR